MKHYFILAIIAVMMVGFNRPTKSQAASTTITPITLSEIATVKSNLVVTGIAVVEKGELRVKGAAIINDLIVWVDKTITVKDGGKKIMVHRDKREKDSLAPYLKLVKVERGKIYLEYGRHGLAPHKFIKHLKNNGI